MQCYHLLLHFDNCLTSLENVKSYKNLESLNISDNQITNLNGIERLEQLKSLDIRGNQITDVSVLENLPEFNTIYVDDDFDRSQLNFMVGNFRNADTLTKEYLLKAQYNLK